MPNSVLDDYVENGLRGKAPLTVKTYRQELETFQRWLDGAGTNLEEFSRTDVQQYIDYLVAKKKSAATINKQWSAIKSFAKWSDRPEVIADIRVVKAMDIKKQAPKALDKVERSKLIREADRSGKKRDFAIIIMLLHTGLRVSELVGLNKGDVDMSDRKGEVRVVGKGNKERTIPLSVEVRRVLCEYLELRTDKIPALFISNRMCRISVRSVQTILSEYQVHPHLMRHTFITGLVRKKEDIAVIQSLSGHSSADMIIRHSQPSEEDMARAVENIYTD